MTPYQPDWRCPDLYPEPGCSDYNRLAWEFIRRNRKYAALYSAIANLSRGEYENGIPEVSTSCLDGFQLRLKAKPGEKARDYYSRLKSDGKKITLIRPHRQFTSIWPLALPVDPSAAYDEEEVKFQEHIVWFKRSKGNGPNVFQLTLLESQIALRFRLDLSWERQLDDAKRRFMTAQVEYKEKPGTDVVSGNETKLDMVHYWLRSYDADQQAKKNNGQSRLVNGPTQVAKAFKKEAPSGAYQHDVRVQNALPQTVVDWRKKAREFIEQHKYWLCLDRDVKPIKPDPSMICAVPARNICTKA